MTVLGIHLGHDATAALIDDSGNVLAAVAEERLSRIKYHTGFPYRAIDEVLRIAGISKQDVTHVATATQRIFFPGLDQLNEYFLSSDLDYLRANDLFNMPSLENKFLRLGKLLVQNLKPGRGQNDDDVLESAAELTRDTIRKKLDELGFAHAALEVVEHHHTHAAGAFFTSGVRDALIITIDGAGDGLCATATLATDGVLKRISGANADCSPGRFYSEITRFAGFKRNRHEGKITGLAAFGNPEKYYPKLKPFLRFNPGTEQFEFDAPALGTVTRKLKTVQRILNNENFGNPYVEAFFEFLKKNFDPAKDIADLAAAAQRIVEEIAVEYTEHFRKSHPASNVVLAGGLFANVRVNQKIAELSGVDYMYVHQNMGDGGCALGAALSCLHESNKRPSHHLRPANVYWGAEFSNSEIEECLRKNGMPFEQIDDIEPRIAELIHQGKVVGRFDGRMEYGPRALGTRSILASPTDKSINDWLNKALRRTEFMPFAPAVLAEHADELFCRLDNGGADFAARFMTVTFEVQRDWAQRTAATTHIDGTARPQLVRSQDNPSYYRIIEEYYKLSGIPVVINTSFNIHEEPIVNSPDDAIRAFRQGAIDYLAIGNYLCATTDNSSAQNADAAQRISV